MTFTKEQLVKEAANTLIEMGDDSFFVLENATYTIKNLLTRLGIGQNDLLAEMLRRQEDGGENGSE